MNLSRSLAVLLSAAALCAPALAADDHKGHDHDSKNKGEHPHDAKPRHGGVVSVVKDVNYELVAKADSLALHVMDHEKPVDLNNASAKVTLLTAAEKKEVTLLPAGDRLEVKGSFKAGAGTKAVAVVSLPGKAATSVRFTLK